MYTEFLRQPQGDAEKQGFLRTVKSKLCAEESIFLDSCKGVPPPSALFVRMLSMNDKVDAIDSNTVYLT